MKQKLQIVIGILLLGAGYAGYLWYQFRSEDLPKMEAERDKLQQEVQKQESELKRLQAFSQNVEKTKKELKELNLQFDSALEYMPRTFDLSKLLRKLTMVADNSGVELATFKPKKGAEEKKGGTFYSSIGIDFDIKGTFTQTLVFLDQLSRLKRIVNIDSIRMKATDGAPQRSGATLIATSATVRTYRYSE